MNDLELDEGADELDLDDFAAAQRRRKLIIGIAAALVALAIAAAIVISRANKLPALDAKTVADVREALDTIPAEHRPMLASKALVELEGERLPAPLLAAFGDLAKLPPGMGDVLLLEPFANDEEALQAWLLACPDGADAIAEAVAQPDGSKALFERCSLARLGLLGETELGGVSVGELVATHAAWAHLVEHGSETPLERRVLRAIMGK